MNRVLENDLFTCFYFRKMIKCENKLVATIYLEITQNSRLKLSCCILIAVAAHWLVFFLFFEFLEIRFDNNAAWASKFKYLKNSNWTRNFWNVNKWAGVDEIMLWLNNHGYARYVTAYFFLVYSQINTLSNSHYQGVLFFFSVQWAYQTFVNFVKCEMFGCLQEIWVKFIFIASCVRSLSISFYPKSHKI